jgi:hypothetical protein
LENKNRQKYARNQEKEKKDYIGLFESKEVKDKNQEEIKNSPLQEMELQEPNNDENTKKAKSKVKICKKNKKVIKKTPEKKIPQKIAKITNSQRESFIIKENKKYKVYTSKKGLTIKKTKK